MDWNNIAKIAAIGFGTYVIGNFILFKTSVGGVSYWEIRGYINGLVRASSSRDEALNQLNSWRSYWLQQNPWASSIINHFYQYGLSRSNMLYY